MKIVEIDFQLSFTNQNAKVNINLAIKVKPISGDIIPLIEIDTLNCVTTDIEINILEVIQKNNRI